MCLATRWLEESSHSLPVQTSEVAVLLVLLLCDPCWPVFSITGTLLPHEGRAPGLLSFMSMQPPRKYCCCYGNYPACMLHISECRLHPVLLSKCLGPAWFGRESEGGWCFSQIVQLAQIGQCRVLQPFGLGGWASPYLTFLLCMFLLFLNVPHVAPTCYL